MSKLLLHVILTINYNSILNLKSLNIIFSFKFFH